MSRLEVLLEDMGLRFRADWNRQDWEQAGLDPPEDPPEYSEDDSDGFGRNEIGMSNAALGDDFLGDAQSEAIDIDSEMAMAAAVWAELLLRPPRQLPRLLGPLFARQWP